MGREEMVIPTKESLNLNDRLSSVYDAFMKLYPPQIPTEATAPMDFTPGPYIIDVWDTCVYVKKDKEDYKVPYTVADSGEVAFAPETEWEKSEKVWKPVKEATPVDDVGGPTEMNVSKVAVEPSEEDKGWNAFCPKCKKNQNIVEAKETTVGKRKGMMGLCEACKSKVSWFPDAAKESARYVSEGIPLLEAKLDSTAKTVEVTIIRPGWSMNDRYYSSESLKESAALFENCKAYADHPARNAEVDRPERSIRDIVGYYPKVWVADNGAIMGQLKIIGESVNWLWPLIEETVNTGVPLVSTSINALGKVTEGEIDGRKGAIVQKIIKANSADIVTQAAAGGKFERLLASDDSFTKDLIAAMDYDEWVTSRPEYAVRLRDEMKTARKDEVNEAVRKELDETKAALLEATTALATEKAESEKKLSEIQTASETKLTEAQKTVDTAVAESETKLSEATRALGSKDAEIVELKGASDKAIAELKESYEAQIAELTESKNREITELVEAKGNEIAELQAKLAAGDSAYRADKLIWEANLPEGLREETRKKIMGKETEDAKGIIESVRQEARKLVLEEGTVPVKETPKSTPSYTNPVASVLGVNFVSMPGETAEAYAARKRAAGIK